jgi:hypothetical protein
MTACAVTVLWIKQRPRRISHDSTAGGGMDKLSVPEQQNRTRAGRSRRRMNGKLQFRFRREFMSFDEIIEELPKLTRFAGQAAEGVDPTEHHCLHSASDDNSPVPGELFCLKRQYFLGGSRSFTIGGWFSIPRIIIRDREIREVSLADLF